MNMQIKKHISSSLFFARLQPEAQTF